MSIAKVFLIYRAVKDREIEALTEVGKLIKLCSIKSRRRRSFKGSRTLVEGLVSDISHILEDKKFLCIQELD